MPPRLRSLLQRCFEKNPKRRWLAIGDVRMELEQISVGGGTPVTIAPIPGASYGVSWGRDGNILWASAQGILRVPATGGMSETVIKATSGELFHGPRPLPDGQTLLFTVTRAAGPTRWDLGEVVARNPVASARF